MYAAYASISLLLALVPAEVSLPRAQLENAIPKLSRIGEIFVKTKTVCVGRYMLEVPHTATVVYGPSSAPYPIERYPDQAARFEDLVQEFAKDALVRKSKFPIGPASSAGSLVGTIKPGVGAQHKIVYGVDKGTGAFYTLQSVFVLGTDLYVQEHSHYGDPSELEKVEEELKSIATRTILRPLGVPLEKAGVCIDGALVLDKGTSRFERTTLGIRLKEFNDVHVALDMILKDRLVESDALEPRLQEAEEDAKRQGRADWYSRIKFFRRGKRTISKWQGFEVLARRPPQENIPSLHEFSFVSQGVPGNPNQPVITLELYTGVKGNTFGAGAPTLRDDEVIELWDRLTNSITPMMVSHKVVYE
jgi:hypothetical protein